MVAAISEKDSPVVLKNVKKLNAIFLVYANVPRWDTIYLQQKITSIQELQNAVIQAAFKHGTDTNSAFPFLLFASIKEASGHIMFKDTMVKTINSDALKAAKHITHFSSQKAQLLGFYSQHHQTIFTHHDSFLHLHYLVSNNSQAGHLDEISFSENEPVQLLIPHQ
jgi:acetolactate decarboxylase